MDQQSEETNQIRAQRSSGRTVALLMIITALTKVFGFFREILFGRWYGVEEVAEAFKIAQNIPMLLLLIVGTGISTGFIPIYTKLANRRLKEEADRFMSNLMNTLILLSLLFSVFVTLFPGLFVHLFASGFTGSKYDLTVVFTQIAVWGTVFNMVTYILAPYLQLHNQYMAPALMVIPGNLVFILCFYLGLSMNPLIVAASIVLAITVQLLWLIPFVMKYHYRWAPVIQWSDPNLRRFFLLAAPVIVGVAVNQVNIIVDKNIASNLMSGGVAILDYANRMTNFVQAIFIYPVAAVFFPKMTQMIVDKNYQEAAASTTNSLITLGLIVLPCSAGLMLFAQPIIALLFEGDAFGAEAVLRTGQAMFWYAAGLFFWAWRDILVRVYYAFGNTKTPTINAMIGVAVNVILNLILSRYIGLNGLAMATSISGLISCLLMLRGIRRSQGLTIDYRLLASRLLKILAATVIMSINAWLVYHQLFGSFRESLTLIFSIVSAVGFYAVTILLLRIPEVKAILEVLNARRK